MRILRVYRRLAQLPHWCDRCCRYIEPGEFYEGSVQIYGGRFIVFKVHIEPSCDYPPDPVEDEISDIAQEETPSQLAA